MLKGKGVSFDKGLSEEEVGRVKEVFEIDFPDDLRLFLQTALPVSESFVHWRYAINSDKGRQEVKRRLDWPLEGILFDIQHNVFWWDSWGPRPADYSDQKRIAVTEIKKQPTLIPIFSHRYIASQPSESGNPVYSVYQTDIIEYGVDLIDYFDHEFGLEIPASFGEIEQAKRIRFWCDLVDRNNGNR